ncbi:MAG: hypothetical protein GXP10_01095 [Gammaproteobacteria bacterium]|nr:hypothetical protein [Gammaproteobacteria bacterium]
MISINIDKTRFLAIAAVSVTPLLFSGIAGAATPAFDEWGVTSGNITSTGSWAAGGTDVVKDTGFLQTQMTDASGETYIRQVIAEEFAGSPGFIAFSDESIIKVNFSQNPLLDTNNGIALKSVVNDEANPSPGVAWDFDSVAIINTGWATASGGNNDSEVLLENTYSVGTGVDGGGNVTGQTFNFGFDLDQYDNNGDGIMDAKSVGLTQGVALGGGALETPGSGDNTMFALQELSGAYSTGGAISGLNTGAALGLVAGYSETVDWTAGETIKIFGIGQQIALGATSGGASASFGHIQVETKGDGAVASAAQIGFASAGGGQAEPNPLHIGNNATGTNPGQAAEDWVADADLGAFANPFTLATTPVGSSPIPALFNNDSTDTDHAGGHSWAN